MPERDKNKNVSDRRRLPPWMRKRIRESESVVALKRALRGKRLHTVCESAGCPNITQCFQKPTATFMILGNACTRNCRFCGVPKGKPQPLDPDEPRHLAEAAKTLELKHVVITSVTRDDLEDGGADQFAKSVHALHHILPNASTETLIPDFQGSDASLKTVLDSGVDILNHNVETVPRLYGTIRPEADFNRSVNVLKRAKDLRSDVMTKSGLMVGLGETFDEVMDVLRALADVACDAVTIGQYLPPSHCHVPVKEYVHPDIFNKFREEGEKLGFKWVHAGPYVRSSFNAEELMYKVKGIERE